MQAGASEKGGSVEPPSPSALADSVRHIAIATRIPRFIVNLPWVVKNEESDGSDDFHAELKRQS